MIAVYAQEVLPLGVDLLEVALLALLDPEQGFLLVGHLG